MTILLCALSFVAGFLIRHHAARKTSAHTPTMEISDDSDFH